MAISRKKGRGGGVHAGLEPVTKKIKKQMGKRKNNLSGWEKCDYQISACLQVPEMWQSAIGGK